MRHFSFYLLSVLVLFAVEISRVVAGQHPLFTVFQRKAIEAAASQDESDQLTDAVTALRSFLRDKHEDLLHAEDDIAWNTNVTEACSNDIMVILQHVRQRDTWALQFVDAAAKPEDGILRGNFAWFGAFGECRSARAVLNNETEFSGKYCLASLGPEQNASASPPPQNPEGPTISLALRIGICYPDTCTDADTYQLLTNLVAIAYERANITGVQVYNSVCQPVSYPYDTKAFVALSVIGVFTFVLALGTLFDIAVYQPRLAAVNVHSTMTTVRTSYPRIGSDGDVTSVNGVVNNGVARINAGHSDDDDAPLLDPKETLISERTHRVSTTNTPEVGILGELLLVFSVYTNTKKLLSTAQSDQALACIHGIRFFSMTWVVLAHSYVFIIYVLRDIATFPEVLSNFWFQAIANASVAVDSFFTMSGLLLCYLFVLNYQKTKKFPIIMYYVHRYWRLTAVYVVIMGVYLFLFKYLNTGPQWNPDGMEIDGCRDTWWTNLLYVNNLVNTEKQCMGWTWYLANDMQFYWISPLILFPLVKIPVIGIAVMAVLFIAHIIATAVLSVQYNFPPSLLGNGLSLANMSSTTGDGMWKYFEDYYSKPWTRIGPYLIGMLFGYLLVKYKQEKLKLRSEVVAALWASATAVALAVLYGLYGINNGHPFSPTESAVYNTLHRNGWALALCWVIFACVQGYGGFVNTILSWSVLVPLSRVTYCCYLLHIPIMLIFYLGKTKDVDFSHLEIVYYFFGTLMITYGFAFLFTIGCESPLLGLERMATRRKKDSKRSI